MAQDNLDVYATRDGFYDKYRKSGEAFTIRNPDKTFSKRWMVPADTEEGRAFIKNFDKRAAATKDAITGEKLMSGGDAEKIANLTRELAEAKAQLEAQGGEPTQNAATPVAAETETTDEAPAAAEGKRRRRTRAE